jgi:hypothetical protein
MDNLRTLVFNVLLRNFFLSTSEKSEKDMIDFNCFRDLEMLQRKETLSETDRKSIMI